MQRIIRKNGVNYHKFADDTQLYDTYYPSVPGDRDLATVRLTKCISELHGWDLLQLTELRQWMARRWLKLNSGKTEMVIFMSRHQLKRYGQCSIAIYDIIIAPVDHVRNLDANMDQHLTMVNQVTATCAVCNYHLYILSSTRRYLTRAATKLLSRP